MDLNATPLSPQLLLNAVEAAHDTLLPQISKAIAKMPLHTTITIEGLAKALGLNLAEYADTLAAHRFFIDTAKEALSYEGYVINTPRRSKVRRSR
jgi:hypothetical protein